MTSRDGFGPSDTSWFYACAIIRDPATDRLLFEIRTDDAPRNPGMWSFFGGGAESGESPEACLLRELREELGVTLRPTDLRAIRSYLNPRTSRRRHVFEVTCLSEGTLLVVSESAGYRWIDAPGALQQDLSVSTRKDLDGYIAETGPARSDGGASGRTSSL
jgi:8-oxo-dGTP pyrophosphatase MutT (NUDIX family)